MKRKNRKRDINKLSTNVGGGLKKEGKMEFKRMDKEALEKLAPYFNNQTTRMSVYSIAYQIMWNEEMFMPEYTITNDNLVFKGTNKGKTVFFYPISQTGKYTDEEKAVCEIENYCRKEYCGLTYLNVPKEKLGYLCSRYTDVRMSNERTWDDYLYKVEEFKSFSGKKFSGQRNHVNKFYKNYPNAEFKVYKKEEEGKLLAFLDEYKDNYFHKETGIAKKELLKTKDLIPHIERYKLCCGFMEIDNKIVSVAIGEICGDTLIEHVEKANNGYEGIYPATAQAFVRKFAGERTIYLNREDDAGDLGLRKSKLQYNPCGLVRKYMLEVEKPLKKIKKCPVIKTDRLIIKKMEEKDKEAYFKLASDTERNKWWGYDYREILKGKEPDADLFMNVVKQDFLNRDEMSLGIYLKEELIGETVLHNCGYRGETEVGVRLLKEYEGKGYARETVCGMIEFAFTAMVSSEVQAKCFKENIQSRRMLEGAGMRYCGEDEKFYYFYKNAKM